MKLDTLLFNRLFTDYRSRYVRFAVSYLRDSFLAEDMYVESMMTLWQNKDSLPDDTNAPAYVLRILRNKCIDYLRRCRLNQEYCEQRGKAGVWELDFRISSLEKFVPEDVFKHEIESVLRETLAGLSEESRRVFLLSRREGRSVKEIASMTGLSEKGVEYHITKVNKVLKVRLKDYIAVLVFLYLVI